MKFKILSVSICLLLSTTTAFAQLSAINKRRFELGILQCRGFNNELTYKEFWSNLVKPENLELVCNVEQFAIQVAADGDIWLEKEAIKLIDGCSDKPTTDTVSYFSCIKTRLDQEVEELVEPCTKLEVKPLWSKDKCRDLVSYLFSKNFTSIFASHESSARANEPPVKMFEDKLSLSNSLKIEQAVKRCEQSNNELVYKKYWGDSIDSENQNSTCVAEQFADQLAADGNIWIETMAVDLIEQCEKQGRKEKKIYFYCLEKNLKSKVNILSSPCKELGKQGMWDYPACKDLVSYIFMEKFDNVLKHNTSLWERFNLALDGLSKGIFIKFFINPVMAILVFVLFVLDVVFLIEKGTWMRVTKTGLGISPVLLIACFTKGGIQLLFSAIVMVVMFAFIVFNHYKFPKKPKKKKPKPLEF